MLRLLEYKHLGITLDNKLELYSHIREAILKARRGIGLVRYLSKYVPWYDLCQVYKLHERLHQYYGDIIIYHKSDPQMHIEITKQLE